MKFTVNGKTYYVDKNLNIYEKRGRKRIKICQVSSPHDFDTFEKYKMVEVKHFGPFTYRIYGWSIHPDDFNYIKRHIENMSDEQVSLGVAIGWDNSPHISVHIIADTDKGVVTTLVTDYETLKSILREV